MFLVVRKGLPAIFLSRGRVEEVVVLEEQPFVFGCAESYLALQTLAHLLSFGDMSRASRKPHNPLHIVQSHPPSPHQRNSKAPTIERSRAAGSRVRGPNLTPYERSRTLESIADQFPHAPSTISRTVRGALNHNESTESPQTGRPRTCMPRD